MAAPLPLQGIRVINFGWVWAGPVVGQTLAFLGAEVLKIESRARIDMTRNLPPFAEGIVDPNRSLSNNACWAGNGSVTLDLKQAEARALALRLIAESDVVIENFGPGVMERLGFGYEALRAVKPDIVLFSMPAAGLYGPLEHVRTYGLSLTSLTGLDSLVGYKGGDPVPVENAFADPFAGIFGSFAIIVALNHRRHTGEGQHIDFSQQEAVMQMVGPAYMDYAFNGRSGGPKGNEHPTAAATTAGSPSRSAATTNGVRSCRRWANRPGPQRPSWRSSPDGWRRSTTCTPASASGRGPSTTASSPRRCRLPAWPPPRCSTSATCWTTRTTARAAPSSRRCTRWAFAKRSTAAT